MALDVKTLLEHFDNDYEILVIVKDEFFKGLPLSLSKIDHSITAKESKDLELSAHNLKGAVSNFFCENCVELSSRLEVIGHERDLDSNSVAILSELKEHLNILEVDLNKLVAEKG